MAFCAAARALIAARLAPAADRTPPQELLELLLIADQQRYADSPTTAVEWSRWLAVLRRAASDRAGD
jgi:hypothetical protein